MDEGAVRTITVNTKINGGTMNIINRSLAALLIIVVYHNVDAQHHHTDFQLSSKKSPALAAALSLQPLPVDLGNFYAGNWKRGVLYSAAQLALFVPAAVLVAERSDWGHHRYYGNDDRRPWTRVERERFYYLVGGYFLVKMISAFDAGYTVERSNATLSVRYEREHPACGIGLSMAVPIR